MKCLHFTCIDDNKDYGLLATSFSLEYTFFCHYNGILSCLMIFTTDFMPDQSTSTLFMYDVDILKCHL